MTAEPEATPLPLAIAAVEDLRHAHRELLRAVDALSPADWERYVPYGEWTVKDLVSHCIGDMSPSGPGLILAGVLTPEFIAETSKSFDVRKRNRSLVEERSRYTRDDLRQLLFEAHDAMIAAMLRLDESHLPVLAYAVPMGPEYNLRVEDWLWHGYHDRQHTDDIRRALAMQYRPEPLTFLPEVDERMRAFVRSQEGFIRAAYSVADEAWGEPAPDCPGWTYHDILAHVASNERRLQARFRHALGAATDAEVAAMNNVDEWNAERTGERKASTLRELIDEFAAGRHETTKVVASVKPDQLANEVRLDSESVPLLDFIDRVSRHTSVHAGQLVSGSRARRVS